MVYYRDFFLVGIFMRHGISPEFANFGREFNIMIAVYQIKMLIRN